MPENEGTISTYDEEEIPDRHTDVLKVNGTAMEALQQIDDKGFLDFYCPGYRLGIELDGASHDYKYEYDEQRTEYLRQQGIRVLRFSNQQVFTSMQGVLAEIVRAANEVTDPTPNPSP